MDEGKLTDGAAVSSGLEAFDFNLPEERIALRPVSPRSAARMLVVASDGRLHDARVADLPEWLGAEDLLVFNDTRVLPARLSGLRRRGEFEAGIRVTLLRELESGLWDVLAKPLGRLKAGDRLELGTGLDALVESVGDGVATLRFDVAGEALAAALDHAGSMPLPPYIARAPDDRDRDDYQTAFARVPGAVAAPTAGLHFDAALLADLERAGIRRSPVTLHVGGGTFRPIRGDIESHQLDAEWGEVPAATAEAIAGAKRVVAVGTTTLRLLEQASLSSGWPAPWSGETRLFLRPGHRFRTAGALLTNFHLPRSTLFMLVCAFAGVERMQRAYSHAMDSGYRFYSYGDACLLQRQVTARSN